MKAVCNPQTISAFEGFFIEKTKSKFKYFVLVFLGLFVCNIPAARCSVDEIFIITSDYETGGYASLNISSQQAQHESGTIYSDAVARFFEDKIYVIERWHGDNITVFQKDNLHNPIIQFSVGSGSNPHDFLLINNSKAYITLYEESFLVIVNPSTGKTTGKIDLSGFADNDGIPEMDIMLYHDNKVFVSLQGLDRNSLFQPSGLSRIVVIDPEKDTVIDADPERAGIQAIELKLTNPLDMKFVPEAGKILVAEAGSFFSASDGGFEFVNPSTLQAEGIIMTESEMGGQIGGAFRSFSMVSRDEGYAIVTTGDWQTQVVRFNLATRSVFPVHAPGTGFVHADILALEDMLFVCDRNMQNPGIRVFDTNTDTEITMAPIDVGLPPYCMVPVEKSLSAPSRPGDNDTDPVPPPEPVECPVEFLFGQDHKITSWCRFLRDSVLSRSEEGRKIIELYYKYLPEFLAEMNEGMELLSICFSSEKKKN